jgi:hypothetical protein
MKELLFINGTVAACPDIKIRFVIGVYLKAKEETYEQVVPLL